jgi:hypothetical protein
MNLSTELVDAIVNLIDDPRDVLSAALACKRLYQIIVPSHLEFRHIRCDPRQNDLWNGLSQRPALAEKVRFLEIKWTGRRDQNALLPQEILPRSMGLVPLNASSFPNKSLDLTPLVTAMERMDSLVRFSWIGLMPESISHLLKAIDNLLSPLNELEIRYEEGTYNIGTVNILSEALPVSNFL